jgi:pimeloyl-ACP methyl ester carboxylesterase
MWHSPQGVHAFLRAYFHNKSADWRDNRPQRLEGWTAGELAKLPTYYIMDLGRGHGRDGGGPRAQRDGGRGLRWLTEAELAVYAAEYARTGFQGGLQWYRCRTEGLNDQDLRVFSGRTIDVPAIFVAGAQDWGIHQAPGALDAMRERACTRLLGIHLIEGAGHWVQQERPRQ